MLNKNRKKEYEKWEMPRNTIKNKKENNGIFRIVNERTLLYNQYKGKQSKNQNNVMQNEIV